ncbi:MAG: response regulator transcription factor [Pseudomonadota bacterium]
MATMQPDGNGNTRVMIVDDHPMVAEGIEAILESYADLSVVATLSNGQEAIDRVEALAPDVILMDLNMPEVNGLSATEIILERAPDTKILILSMHDSAEYISTALSHGARGYVLKDVPTDAIKKAIDKVMAGERYLCTGAEASLAPDSSPEREALTSREQTILLQLARGLSNKEVANALGISVRTVETHRKNIKRKLGISSTAGLTRYALEHGVLQGTGMAL